MNVLEEIRDRLGWCMLWLFCITLNTCSACQDAAADLRVKIQEAR